MIRRIPETRSKSHRNVSVKTKKEFQEEAAFLRRLQNSKLSCGASGYHGGIDGEMSSPTMYHALSHINKETIFSYASSYGLEIGSGTGMTAFAYYNNFLGIPMLGAESNSYRANFSWKLQRILSSSPDQTAQRVSKMSIFLHGDATDVIRGKVGENPALIHVAHWFCQGWSDTDKIKFTEYMNRFIRLEWLVTNLTQIDLKMLGFKQVFLAPSVQFSGPLVRSPSGRTIYVHHLKPKATVLEKVICSEAELSVVRSFKSPQLVNYSVVQSMKMESIEEDLKHSRHTRHKRKAELIS